MILEKVYPGLRFFDTEVLVLAVCNEGLLGHYPGGGLFNSDTVPAVDDFNNKDKGKKHEVRIPVNQRKGRHQVSPFQYTALVINGTPNQWTIPGSIGRLNLYASPKLFFVVFCRILDFLTSLFDLLPGFFHRLIDLLAGALRRAFFFLAAG